MTTEKTVKVIGKIDADLLADYAGSVDQYDALLGETISATVAIEIEYMRASVGSGLSQLDQIATLKAGKEQAKQADRKVLPDLGTGKVQVWAVALDILDTVVGADSMDIPALLNLAWNSQRAPEGSVSQGQTVEGLEAVIPAREPSKGNKTGTRKPKGNTLPTLEQLADIVEATAENMPEDLSELSDGDVKALVKMAKRFGAWSRALAKVA